MKTIKLKGKDYIPVSERIKEFHRLNEEGTIKTSFAMETETKGIIFNAVVRLTDGREFTGHAYGKIGNEKAFEKTETVAIGRALALANIGLTDSIASADEMESFHDSVGEQVATNKPADEKVDLAMKGDLLCATCASQVKVSKSGNLYCPKKYDKSDTRNHDNFISRDELGNDPELGYVNKETGEIPTIDEEGNKIPF